MRAVLLFFQQSSTEGSKVALFGKQTASVQLTAHWDSSHLGLFGLKAVLGRQYFFYKQNLTLKKLACQLRRRMDCLAFLVCELFSWTCNWQ